MLRVSGVPKLDICAAEAMVGLLNIGPEKPEKPFVVDAESLFNRLENGFDDGLPKVELVVGVDDGTKLEDGVRRDVVLWVVVAKGLSFNAGAVVGAAND